MSAARRVMMPDAVLNRHRSILTASGECFLVSVHEIESDERTARVALARHVAMWITRKTTKLSLLDISSLFQRDHGTVIHACRRIESLIAHGDPESTSILRLLNQFTTQPHV